VRGQELIKGVHFFFQKIRLIQEKYREFDKHLKTRLVQLQQIFQAQEFFYLILLFSSCSSVDMVIVDNGIHLGEEKKSASEGQKTSGKKKGKKAKDTRQEVSASFLAEHGIMGHMVDKLRDKVGKHRMREDLRYRILRTVLVRKMRLQSLANSRLSSVIQKESERVRDWVKFAQIFNLMDDATMAQPTTYTAEFSSDPITSIDSSKNMYEMVKAVHSVYGITPHPTRCLKQYEEFLDTNSDLRTSVENRHLKESMAIFNLIKEDNVTIRQLMDVCKDAETTPEIVDNKEEMPTKESIERELSEPPTNLGRCFRHAEISLDIVFSEDEFDDQQQESQFGEWLLEDESVKLK